jgi:hypothetical protein
MEYWSDGILEWWVSGPALKYSIPYNLLSAARQMGGSSVLFLKFVK